MNTNTATLRLFNSIIVDNKANRFDDTYLERTLKNGYILDPSIRTTPQLLDEVESVIGISGEKANNAFHKSWAIIRDTPQEILWLQAAIHYATTYGFESLGIYNSDTVYIPAENLEVPGGHMPITVVRGFTQSEILDKIVELGSGIALHEDTLNDIMTIVEECNFDSTFVNSIKNRELLAKLYDYYNLVPQDPVAYLRYVVNKLTNESLLIKNSNLIDKIKSSDCKVLDVLLKDAPHNLASIFFRFKPIFLALKKASSNKGFFNRLRKQANKLHEPLPEDYLNSVTGHIKNGTLKLSRLCDKLDGASLFRKTRLAYALKFRLSDPESIVYKIRNGRGWASDFVWEDYDDTKKVLDLVLDSIASNIKVERNVYIPENITYTVPATEKQFIGHFPNGTYVSVPDNLIVGVHWFNTDRRIDLDLSLISTSKIGWDASYKSGDALFSGDVTNAPKPKGASELFYVKKVTAPYLLMLNYFNYVNDDPVPCKLFVASKPVKALSQNYMVDPKNIVSSLNLNIDKKQNCLGLIDRNRFYYSNISVGNSITSSYNKNSQRTRSFLWDSLVESITLEDVLVRAGVNIIREKEDGCIDLSPECLDKNTIVGLLS